MKSIRSELTYKLLLGSYLLPAVAGVWLYFHLRASLTDQYDAGILLTATSLADDFEFLGTGFRFESRPESMEPFQPGPAPDYFEFWAAKGVPLMRSASLRDKDLPAVDRAESEGYFFDLHLPDGRVGRGVAIRFLARTGPENFEGNPEPRKDQQAIIVYAGGREELDANLHSLALALGALGLLLPMGSTLLVRSVVRRSLFPLDRLGSEVQSIRPEQLDRRLILANLPQELTPLVARLNDLMQRVDNAAARERRFTDNISHELRTPLAELRMLTELALSEIRSRNSGLRLAGSEGDSLESQHDLSLAPLLSDCRSIGIRVERILTTLLALSRCDAGVQTLSPEWIELPSLVREIFQSLEQKALERGLQARFQMPRSASVYADQTLLAGILSNLVSNSVSHASPGTWFECRAEVRGDSLVICLSNPCTTISSDDLEQLWEPFWCRARPGDAEDHAGLGLALVRTYARALGGEVKASLSPEGTFSVEFRSQGFRVIAAPDPAIDRPPASRVVGTRKSSEKTKGL